MTNIIDISPRLLEYQRRAALIGAKADVRPEHYTFQRTQKLYTPPLQRSAPVKASWLRLALECLAFIAAITTTIYLWAHLPEWAL